MLLLTLSHAAEAGFGLLVLLSLSSNCQDYRQVKMDCSLWQQKRGQGTFQTRMMSKKSESESEIIKDQSVQYEEVDHAQKEQWGANCALIIPRGRDVLNAWVAAEAGWKKGRLLHVVCVVCEDSKSHLVWTFRTVMQAAVMKNPAVIRKWDRPGWGGWVFQWLWSSRPLAPLRDVSVSGSDLPAP